ncbi:MAG: cyclase [Chloroflexi bacterium]|nr:cyclase [Chloroflexota bacterium]
MAQEALTWLRHNQLADGSWGAITPLYHHDRAICTMAAIIALKENNDPMDLHRIQMGVDALDYHLELISQDQAGETIAFELLMPTLMMELKSMGLMKKQDTAVLNRLSHVRTEKLARVPGGVISKKESMSFSSEMAGKDAKQILDPQNLQEPNGSIGYSPSATAYYLINVDPKNEAALSYLRRHFKNGGLPNVATIDIFEPTWSLWNLSIGEILTQDQIEDYQYHLDHLEASWDPTIGSHIAFDWSLYGCDDTSMVYHTLHRYGRFVDISGLFHYEKETHFRCFAFEKNPSISANIHVLSALYQAGYPSSHPSVVKIIQFLSDVKSAEGYWIDKWHVSPYYPTSHLIMACAGYSDELIKPAIEWIMNTQRFDGSWGHYVPSAEETAYCLQALTFAKRDGHSIPNDIIQNGFNWLNNHISPPYPPLWIGKCLYSPTNIVISAVLSALSLCLSE